MIIAQERRKKNIAEYIIYMFQIEDVLRALECNENNIEKYVRQTFAKHQEKLEEILNWYLGLNDLMKSENLERKGHLSIVMNNVKELEDFHNKLLQHADYTSYNEKYNQAIPFIQEFKQRAQAQEESEIIVALHAMYSKFLLKLKNVEITSDTETAFTGISNFLALLAVYFKDYETGKIEL